MSGLTSNDVVILTGTVFLSYFTRVSDIHPTAFLMSEFTTANIGECCNYASRNIYATVFCKLDGVL